MISINRNLRNGLYGLFIILACSCTDDKVSPKNKPDTQANGDTRNTALRKLDIAVMDSMVRIGNQIWMLRNLDVTKFRNGDPIFEAKTNPEWQKRGNEEKPVFGYYQNKANQAQKTGNIYNWYAVQDPRGLCPHGWRVPTQKDWQDLIDYLGGKEQAGSLLKNIEGWGGDGNGNNLSGFAALPGGFRGYDGISYSVGYMARWWTSTEQSEFFAHGFDINYDQTSINPSIGYKQDGFSVRCIKE